MSRNKILFSILIIIIVFILSACIEDDKIMLGFIGDLSGNSSFLSRSGLQGTQMAIEEYNNSGGYSGTMVEIIAKDNFGDYEKNKVLIDEFEEENVEVVIGPYLSEMVVPNIDYINSKELLLISPTISSGMLSKKDDNFIRVIGELEQQGNILADLAIENNHKDILVIYNTMNESFTKSLIDSFSENLTNQGGNIVRKIEYKSILEEIDSVMDITSKEEFDGIMFLGNGFDTAYLAQNLRKQSIDKQLYLSLWSNTKDLIEEGGNAINGVFILDFIDSTNKTTDYSQFMTKYIDKYGEEPTFSSVFSYESTKIYLDAIDSVNYNDWEKIKDEIIDTSHVNGLQNSFEIDAYGDSNRRYIPFQIKYSTYK